MVVWVRFATVELNHVDMNELLHGVFAGKPIQNTDSGKSSTFGCCSNLETPKKQRQVTEIFAFLLPDKYQSKMFADVGSYLVTYSVELEKF